ncbi:hypothetical protein [Burkholderia sp. SRS-W-2-2016]|uniref:hypothetical protein n=1 Tax=Burkholderia sp. SRS-W-2-2016 TaxID=1926878 RepID=UPI00117E217F|nr:hypothetical protein [Burkholderia sp. SRS-W-2-2016]
MLPLDREEPIRKLHATFTIRRIPALAPSNIWTRSRLLPRLQVRKESPGFNLTVLALLEMVLWQGIT